MKDGISWLVAINANDFGFHSFGNHYYLSTTLSLNKYIKRKDNIIKNTHKLHN